MKSNAGVCVALFLKQQNEYTKMYRPFVKIIKKIKGGLLKNDTGKNEWTEENVFQSMMERGKR